MTQNIGGYWIAAESYRLLLVVSYEADCEGLTCTEDYPGTAEFPCEGSRSQELHR
jgi:hypothetical protein